MWIVFREKPAQPEFMEAARWELAGATEHGAHDTAAAACEAIASERRETGRYAAVRVEPVNVETSAHAL